LTLPAETVRRDLPDLWHPEDAVLFEAEREKVLPAVAAQAVSGTFLPSGWSLDQAGWRGTARRVWSRLRLPARTPQPAPGRRFLIATDRFSNGYFHWVTETLPRLWWARDLLPTAELLLPAFSRRFAYMDQSLALFPDLERRVASDRERWRLSGALLLPPTAPAGNYRPDLVQAVGAAWRARVQPREPFRRLYISRSKAARRRIANEEELLPKLIAAGYEVVHLEGLPFADQVRLLAETKELVSNHGAGLTNMLFMVPGTRVTEIRLAGDAHNNCYFSLARALGLVYDYRLADPADPGRSAHDGDVVVQREDFP